MEAAIFLRCPVIGNLRQAHRARSMESGWIDTPALLVTPPIREEFCKRPRRHNVDKNPADFEAHYNLGTMLQGRGDLAGAEKQYAIALSIRPENATVNNAIAGANLAAGIPMWR